MSDTAWGRQRLAELTDDVYMLQYQNRQFADQVEEAQSVWVDTRSREFAIRVLGGYLSNAQQTDESLARQGELLQQGVTRLEAAVGPETELYNLSDETTRAFQTTTRYAAEAFAEANVVLGMAKESSFLAANADRILAGI